MNENRGSVEIRIRAIERKTCPNELTCHVSFLELIIFCAPHFRFRCGTTVTAIQEVEDATTPTSLTEEAAVFGL